MRTLVMAVAIGLLAAAPQGVSIETAHDDPAEREAVQLLRRLIDEHELDPWLFTDRILVDRDTGIPHSHPVLTLNTDYSSEVDLLGTLIHENIHWFVMENQSGLAAAIAELERRYPDAPDGPPEGARDLRSTYLHLVVCSLEYAGLEQKVGHEAATELLRAKTYYRWVYRTIVDDVESLRALLSEHDLVLP